MAFENLNKLSKHLPDFYCVVKDKEQDFYWIIDLEDHPNSFLLDRTHQQLISPEHKEDQESIVIIQPQNR